MNKKFCLAAALLLATTSSACSKLNARIQLKDANRLYTEEKYTEAITAYEQARRLDPTFAEIDRMIGYSLIGLYRPDTESAENQKVADRAVLELQKYLQKRPDDTVAKEALINLFLNAERTTEAIRFFQEDLKKNPQNLDAARSVARLYAQQGDFNEALGWYQKVAQMDNDNPEAFYTYGVVVYEKVAKNPPETMEERFQMIAAGRKALQRAIDLNRDYFEANVYMNLLYREEAKLIEDPDQQQALYAKADEYRNRAIEITKARKAAASKDQPADKAEKAE